MYVCIFGMFIYIYLVGFIIFEKKNMFFEIDMIYNYVILIYIRRHFNVGVIC